MSIGIYHVFLDRNDIGEEYFFPSAINHFSSVASDMMHRKHNNLRTYLYEFIGTPWFELSHYSWLGQWRVLVVGRASVAKLKMNFPNCKIDYLNTGHWNLVPDFVLFVCLVIKRCIKTVFGYI